MLDTRERALLDSARQGRLSPPASSTKLDDQQRKLMSADADIHRCQIIVNEEMNFGVDCPADEKSEHSKRFLKKESNLKRSEHSKRRLQT